MTSTELATANGALAIREGQDRFDQYQVAALSQIGIRGATNADLAVFMHYCQRTRLDPFTRQIHMIRRREKQGDQWVDKQVIQVGIDGFRVVARRAARRENVALEYEDSAWCGTDGQWADVWLSGGHPAAARVTVLRDGRRFPGVVRFSAFAQTKANGDPVSMWDRMDAEQLEKCAEAKALRRAFPHDLGGIYIPEEMPPEPPRDIPRLPGGQIDQAQMTEGEKWDTGNMDRAARVEHAELRRAAQEHPGQHERTIVLAEQAPAEPQEAPADPGKKPSNAATGRLQRLLREIPLGPDEDVAALLHWLTGQPLDAELSAHGVRVVTTYLANLLEATDDPEKAAARAWEQYRAAREESAGDA
jgi:phage recombination protein Bet